MHLDKHPKYLLFVSAAVESCLSHGLKRRTLGLFKTSSTTALIHKVGKNYEPASTVSRKVQEIEAQDPSRSVGLIFSLSNFINDIGVEITFKEASDDINRYDFHFLISEPPN